MKVKLFDLGVSTTLVQEFIDSVIVEKIEETKNYLIIYYVDRKTITVDCSELTEKEKQNMSNYLTKVNMKSENGLVVDFVIN
jgi:hypothetical protein